MNDANTYRHRKLMFFAWLRISLIGLIALTNFWALVAQTTGNSHGGRWRDLILIAFVWPVLNHIKASLWLSFVSCLFFTTGVLNAMTDGRELFGIVESILAATIFVSAMMFARNAYRELEAIAESSEQLTT